MVDRYFVNVSGVEELYQLVSRFTFDHVIDVAGNGVIPTHCSILDGLHDTGSCKRFRQASKWDDILICDSFAFFVILDSSGVLKSVVLRSDGELKGCVNLPS